MIDSFGMIWYDVIQNTKYGIVKYSHSLACLVAIQPIIFLHNVLYISICMVCVWLGNMTKAELCTIKTSLYDMVWYVV